MITLVDCACEAHAHKDGSGIEIEYCDIHTDGFELMKAFRTSDITYLVLSKKEFEDHTKITIEKLKQSSTDH